MQCPDCDSPDRRLFLKTAALGAAGAAIAAAVPKKFTGSSETLVTSHPLRRSPNGATVRAPRVAPLGLRSYWPSAPRGSARVARFTPGYYRTPPRGDKTRSLAARRASPPGEDHRPAAE